jgi:negative regulator of flagellin synthesis FlgM
MKIQNGNKPDLLDSLVKTAQVKPQQQKDLSVDQKKGQGDSYDKVEISSKRLEVQRLAEKARAQSVVREERVEELKTKIEDGTYNAKGQIVAGSILKNNILDELL